MCKQVQIVYTFFNPGLTLILGTEHSYSELHKLESIMLFDSFDRPKVLSNYQTNPLEGYDTNQSNR